jgi:hypothetical protein
MFGLRGCRGAGQNCNVEGSNWQRSAHSDQNAGCQSFKFLFPVWILQIGKNCSIWLFLIDHIDAGQNRDWHPGSGRAKWLRICLPWPEWERRLGAWATVTAALQADSESVRITHLESWPPGQLGISRYEILMLQCTWYIAVYLSMRISYLVYTELFWVHHGMGDFIDTQFCHILEWFSNVWICTHACPITRHRGLESKLKKSCADFDLSILRSYRYIPVYTE